MDSRYRHHNNLDALVWLQTSAEWHASYVQAFELARLRIAAAIGASTGGGRPSCVFSDLDETLLDNSAYNEWLVATGRNFNEGEAGSGWRHGSWPQYCIEGISRAKPGALEFLDWLAAQADAEGRPVALFFVTSRRTELRPETAGNLRRLMRGRPCARFAAADLSDDPAASFLFMKGQPVRVPAGGDGASGAAADDKYAHYRFVEAVRGYAPLLWLGDNASDFDPRYASTAGAAARLAAAAADWRFGPDGLPAPARDWIQMPNPVYGSFLRSLRGAAGEGLADDERTEAGDAVVRPALTPAVAPKLAALDPWTPAQPLPGGDPGGGAVVRLRIGTFNVENLFSRLDILRIDDFDATADELARLAELQDLLERERYEGALPGGVGVRERIGQLYDGLRRYLTIRVDRGGTGLFVDASKSPPRLRDEIRGRGDWSGTVELKRSAFDDPIRLNTMRVIEAIRADLLCVVEVEGLVALRDFAAELRRRFGVDYPYAMSIEGNDTRGIDVGVLSRHPITAIETHQFDTDAAGRIFSRDCLGVTVEVPGVGPLSLLCNHLKSLSGRFPGDRIAGDLLRARQVEQILRILAARDLARERVVVLGDLNDYEGRRRDGADQNFILERLVRHPRLVDVVAQRIRDEAERWTWAGVVDGRPLRNRLDYLLVSPPLAAALGEVRIERRGIDTLESLTGERPFDGITPEARNGASDHAAVVAEFVFRADRPAATG